MNKKTIVMTLIISFLLLSVITIQAQETDEEDPKSINAKEAQDSNQIDPDFIKGMGDFKTEVRKAGRKEPSNYLFEQNRDNSVTVIKTDRGEDIKYKGKTFPLAPGSKVTFQDGEITSAEIKVPIDCGIGGACPPTKTGGGYTMGNHIISVGGGGATVKFTKGGGENGKDLIEIKVPKGSELHINTIDPNVQEAEFKISITDKYVPESSTSYKVDETAENAVYLKGSYKLGLNDDTVIGFKNGQFTVTGEPGSQVTLGGAQFDTQGKEVPLLLNKEDAPITEDNRPKNQGMYIFADAQNGFFEIAGTKSQDPNDIEYLRAKILPDNVYGITVKNEVILEAGVHGKDFDGNEYESNSASVRAEGDNEFAQITIKGAGRVINGKLATEYNPNTNQIRGINLEKDEWESLRNEIGISNEALTSHQYTAMHVDFLDENGAVTTYINDEGIKKSHPFVLKYTEDGKGDWLDRNSLERFPDAQINNLNSKDKAYLQGLSREEQIPILAQSGTSVTQAVQQRILSDRYTTQAASLVRPNENVGTYTDLRGNSQELQYTSIPFIENQKEQMELTVSEPIWCPVCEKEARELLQAGKIEEHNFITTGQAVELGLAYVMTESKANELKLKDRSKNYKVGYLYITKTDEQLGLPRTLTYTP